MQTYLILCHPGHRRVYLDAAERVALGELSITLGKLSTRCHSARRVSIAGIGYVAFVAEEALVEGDWQRLSRLSFAYAFFALQGGLDAPALLPIENTRETFVSEHLSSILKYTGKTNELFTRMMVQLAHAASDFDALPFLRLLDPVAGKGTTLYEGLIAGHDVYGMEVGEKIVGEAHHYIKKFMETERYKHTAKVLRQSGANKAFTATRYQYDIARDKQSPTRHFEIIAGNSVYARQFFAKNAFHAIVGDLPYGVQHGNVTNEKQTAITRSPQALLDACLPAWHEVLARGGSLVLAWNLHVFRREAMEDVLVRHGFTILHADLDFTHRVDQAILRDVVIARKA